MTSRQGILIIGFVITSLFTPLYAQECQLPQQISEWDYNSTEAIKQNRDWKNTKIETTYWMLSLSWSKKYCDRFKRGHIPAYAKHQCLNNRFGLIVHGLWAQSKKAESYRQHPRNCLDVDAIKPSIVKHYLCMIPGQQLIQKEWERHGTCDFDNPEQYLFKTRQLFRQLRLPNIKAIESLEYQPESHIKAALVHLNRSIGLQAKHLKIEYRENRLSEVKVCYNLQFQLDQCH